MLYSVLGTSGMRVSKLALGTATFGVAPTEAEADRVIGAALDAGINLIDTANAYGNLAHFDRPGVAPANERASAEEIVGACLKGRRDELVISTKASGPSARRQRPRPVAPSPGGADRPKPAQAGDRPCRPLLRAPPRPGHPARRHHHDARRSRAFRQDPQLRPFYLPGLGISARPVGERQAQPSSPGVPTGPLQPGGPAGGDGNRARGASVRASLSLCSAPWPVGC